MKILLQLEKQKQTELHDAGLALYLEGYESLKIPFLPLMTLSPLTAVKQKKHYADLVQLKRKLQDKPDELNSLMVKIKTLPAIEHLTAEIENHSISTHHLILIGRFLNQLRQFDNEESEFFKDLKPFSQELLPLLNNTQTAFIHNEFEADALKQIEELNQKKKGIITKIENELISSFKLQISYPTPKMLPLHELTDDFLQVIEKNPYLYGVTNDSSITLFFRPISALLKLETQIESLQDKIVHSLELRTTPHRNKLLDHKESFLKLIDETKKKIFQIATVHLTLKNKLIFPEESKNLHIEKGIHPYLQKKLNAQYIPLDLTLKNKDNALLGHNNGGKSTILKTLFFLNTLVLVGLPLPAQIFKTPFYSSVEIHLKNSGELHLGQSSFTDELSFLKQLQEKEDSLFLLDELFSSTNPLSGEKLTTIFINYFKTVSSSLFFTTHQTLLLKNELVNCLTLKTTSSHNQESYQVMELDKIQSTHIEKEMMESPMRIVKLKNFPLIINEQIDAILKEPHDA